MKLLGDTVNDARAYLSGLLAASHGNDEGPDELSREGMEKTPERMVAGMMELLSGYEVDPAKYLITFPAGDDPGMVAVRDMPFASVCEHHVLPFTGAISVVYLPHTRIIGLSKIPRIVRAVSRRLQVQERIGIQVARTLTLAPLAARGVLVHIRGRHTCMALRGIESSGEMITSTLRGVFQSDPAARAEALSLLQGPA